MGNQEKTKEEVELEEIVEEESVEMKEADVENALAEISNENSQEIAVEEITIEEPEGIQPGKVQTEEVSEETKEMQAEETPTEKTTAVERPENEASASIEEKKRIKIGKKAIIIIAAVVAVLVAAYIGVAMHYSDRFLMGTTVNGIDCAGKTVKEVEKLMQMQVEEYVLTLEERNGLTEEINGVDIGIKYNGADVIKEAFKEQNAYAWIIALYNKKNIDATIDFEYDAAKLDEVIAQLNCIKEENQIAPVSAIPVYVNGMFEIEEEVYGTLINQEQLYATIHSSVEAMEEKVDLEANNCYVLPTYTKESPEVIAANEELNQCLAAEITYSLDSITVTVDASMIANWISVDESMTVIVDENQVRAFTDTLGSKYNTSNLSQDITTPTGEVASVPNARLGRVVGSAAECEQLINEIKEGTTVTREPILSQEATPEGELPWGTTYIEVDISAQHMWYISAGMVAFECDVITGSPGRDTPVGSFTILEKLRNKVLRGNIMSNGKREYETPVSYWARVTWSGVGFHDATWQSAFGGELYKQGYGSHGCINMALDDVATFYDMISVGCPVIIHY